MARRSQPTRGSRLEARGKGGTRPSASSLRPPALQRLWAPWRAAYFARRRARGCFLCQAARASATRRRQARVVAKHPLALALPNLYPYNTGHLLIAPTRHVGRLEALRDEEWVALLRLLRELMPRLRAMLRPHGFNLGLNLGAIAGAGLPGHLHLHLVPRWRNDTNFMPIIAETKVLSLSLDALVRTLASPKRGRR